MLRGAEKQALGAVQQRQGEIPVRDVPGGARSREIEIQEQFSLGGTGDRVGNKIGNEISGSDEAGRGEVEFPEIVPDEACLVVEGGGLDGGRGDARDVSSEGEKVSGNMAEVGKVMGRRRGSEEEKGGGIREVDAGIPEAEAELPEVEFEAVVDAVKLRKLNERLAEIGGEGGKQ